MKFFNFILISSYPFGYWVCPDDALSTPEPSHRLYSLCSKRHTLQPKNAAPNTACLMLETPVGEDARSDLSISLQERLYSEMARIQYECAHGPCSQHPSELTHSQHYKFEQPSLGNEPEYRPLVHGNDTSSPILYALLNDLRNENLSECVPYRKSMKFIETKVPAINCRVLTIV